MSDARGSVVWITGLAGAGKTTLATALIARLRACALPAVLLDGDVLRAVFEHDLGYSLEERRRCGRRYARLAGMLAAQGPHVVVATISMFEDLRQWNRAHVPQYIEVYVRAPADVRRRRARLGHAPVEPHDGVAPPHDGARRPAEGCFIVGDDVPFEEPQTPDLVLDNDGSIAPDEVASRLWAHVRRRVLDGG